MKKLIVGVLTAATLVVSAPAMAGGGHHHHGGGIVSTNTWVGPLVGGMVLGAIIQAQRPVYAAPPVVIYQQQPQVIYQQPQIIYQQPVYVPQQYCQPHSEVINGVLVQGQYCYTR